MESVLRGWVEIRNTGEVRLGKFRIPNPPRGDSRLWYDGIFFQSYHVGKDGSYKVHPSFKPVFEQPTPTWQNPSKSEKKL